MATFRFITKTGGIGTVNATTADEALRNAPNIASDSGVQLIQGNTISSRAIEQSPSINIPQPKPDRTNFDRIIAPGNAAITNAIDNLSQL